MRTIVALLATTAIGLTLIGVLNMKPVTYRDIANDEQAHCLATNGDGAWVGSSGVSLADFCRAAGSLAALEQERKDHPERF